MSGTEIESLDSRKLKHGWLYKTAPLLVVSGCGSLQPYCDRRPVSRWLEAAIESVGSHVSLVTEVQLLRRHSSPTRPLVSVLSKRWVPCCDHGPAGPADDQLLLAYRHMGSPSCLVTWRRWRTGQTQCSQRSNASTNESVKPVMPSLAGPFTLERWALLSACHLGETEVHEALTQPPQQSRLCDSKPVSINSTGVHVRMPKVKDKG